MDSIAIPNEHSSGSTDIPTTPTHDQSNTSSNDPPNDRPNDPANDSSYESPANSPNSPNSPNATPTPNVSSNTSSNVTGIITTSNASQNEPQVVSDPIAELMARRRQRQQARLAMPGSFGFSDAEREEYYERRHLESASWSSYDGPGADIAEAMRVTPCCGACFVDLDAPVTAADKLTERMSVLYGFKDQLRYVGHIDSCRSFYTHCTSHDGCSNESPYTIVNGMWCIYQAHPPWRSHPSVKRETWPFGTEPRFYAIAYHQDCYATFIHACSLAPEQARERLWLSSMARYIGSHRFYYMATRFTVFDMSEVAIRAVARAYGLPELARCPIEIIQLIQKYSSSKVFLWRAIMAYTLALQLDSLPQQRLTEYRLVDIVRWKRGEILVPTHPEDLYSDDDEKSVMRITLDLRGIKEIERLPCHPQYSGSSIRSLYFIVEKLATLRQFTACVKDGFLRLSFPESYKYELPVWTTPNPPSFDKIYSLASQSWGPWHNAASLGRNGVLPCGDIDLKTVTNLVFTFIGFELMSIISHPSEALGLSSVKKRLGYLPIPPGDNIVYIGTLRYFRDGCILVRMRLSGDIILNLDKHVPHVDMATFKHHLRTTRCDWSKKNPRGLLFGQHCRVHFTNYILAAISSGPEDEGAATRQPSSATGEHNIDDVQSFFLPNIPRVPESYKGRGIMTYAPLSGVTEAQVFYLDEGAISKGQCLGIVFRYRNGGSRAIGNVWELDSRVYSHPTHFWFDTATSYTRVDFLPVTGADKQDGHQQAEKDGKIRSKYRPMRGTIFAYASEREKRSNKMWLHIEVTDEEMYPGTASVEENRV